MKEHEDRRYSQVKETTEHTLKRLRQHASFLTWVVELIWNSIDHGAKQVALLYSESGQERVFGCRDDGLGMGPQGAAAYRNIGDSVKPPDRVTRGLHGSGGRAVIGIASQFSILTRSKDWKDTKVRRWEFTRDQFLQQEMGEPKIMEDPPRDFPETGFQLVISQFDSRRLISWDSLVQQLANELPPRYARMVRLCRGGWGVNSIKLPERELKGQPYRRTYKDEVLGEIEVDCYVPTQRQVTDVLELTVFGQGQSMISFYDSLRQYHPYLANLCPESLLSGWACGQIDIPGLNVYTSFSRQGFDPRFFQNAELVEALILFLQQLAPELEDNIGVAQTAAEKEQQQQWIELITQRCRVVPCSIENGEDEPLVTCVGVEGKETFSVSIEESETLVGRRVPVEVYGWGVGCSGKFQWNVEAPSKVKYLTQNGQRVELWRPSTGEITALAIDREHPEIHRAVRITVVDQRSLAVSPARHKAAIGSEKEYEIINPRKGKSYSFQLEHGMGRIIESTPTTCRIRFGTTPGTFRITVREGAQETAVAATVQLYEAGGQMAHDRFHWGRHVFIIAMYDLGNDISLLNQGGSQRKTHTIVINDQHPLILREKSKPARLAIMLGETAARVAQAVIDPLHDSPMTALDIRHRFVCGMQIVDDKESK